MEKRISGRIAGGAGGVQGVGAIEQRGQVRLELPISYNKNNPNTAMCSDCLSDGTIGN